MMAAQLRGAEGEGHGVISQESLSKNPILEEAKAVDTTLVNCAGKSKSPFVSAHASNSVAWQFWDEETLALARKENKLLFVSLGFASCHWSHVMRKESFENEDVAAVLNESYIPVLVDKDERPDLDRIYTSFISATSKSAGHPLNVILTPELKPFFGGTYFHGPDTLPENSDQVDILQILKKVKDAWATQEIRSRADADDSLEKTRKWSADGTHSSPEDGGLLDIELLESSMNYFYDTYDSENGGFGTPVYNDQDGKAIGIDETLPKFLTPFKLAALLRLVQYPKPVIDVVGKNDANNGMNMAFTGLKNMALGGIRDHIGHGFFRSSVTVDWSLPSFEKTLSDNAQLLHVYLDAFLVSYPLMYHANPIFLGAVYDIAKYLLTTLAHSAGGFFSGEAADSLYRKGDSEKREGAYYVWTQKEFESVVGPVAGPILSTFFNVKEDGNVGKAHDIHDEFLNQNVLARAIHPQLLAKQLGMEESEVQRIIEEGQKALREHREKERVRPAIDDKIITSWNGIAIGALSRTGAVLSMVDGEFSAKCLQAAVKAAEFIEQELYDSSTKTLYCMWREGRSEVKAFAEDYAFLIEGLIDLYEATFNEKWLHWADDLQQIQLALFFDTEGTGGFFSTLRLTDTPDLILRLKDGMDANEPSANSVSASNLYRLSSALGEASYAEKALRTIAAFEPEICQNPFFFPSFWPSIIASRFGVKGTFVFQDDEKDGEGLKRVRIFEKAPRGALGSFCRLTADDTWLRERNPVLKDFGLDGRTRILIFEKGRRRESVVDDNVALIKDPMDKPTSAPKAATTQETGHTPAIV